MSRPSRRQRVLSCAGCGSRQTAKPPEDLDDDAVTAWLEHMKVCPNCGGQRKVT